MWDGVDRRKFLRAEYPCLITLRKRTPPPRAFLTHTENISVVGVRLFIKEKVEIMTEIDLELELKDTFPNVTAKGLIKWVKECAALQEGKPKRYELGICFTQLKDEDRRRILNIVAHLTKKSR